MEATFIAQVRILSASHKMHIMRVVRDLQGTLKDCRNPKFLFIELPISLKTSYEALLIPEVR